MHGPDVGVAVSFSEEGDSEALGHYAFIPFFEGYRSYDVVDSCSEVSVGLVHERVADVDADLGRVASGYDRQPAAVGTILDLEPSRGILEEQCNEAKVGMRMAALDLARFELLDRQGWVVLDAQLVDVRLHARCEHAHRHFQADFNGCQDITGQSHAVGKENALHPVVKSGNACLRWPWCRVFVTIASVVKVLLVLKACS